MNAGPVWIGSGTKENDDVEHVTCPPETWRRLVQSSRTTYSYEYRVTERQSEIKAEEEDEVERDEDEDEV
jgi:hypothetical protein